MCPTATNLSLQVFSNSILRPGTLKIAIPLYLDRRETVQPKIEQISPGTSKNISRETLCLLLKFLQNVLEHTVTAPYLNYRVRRKLGTNKLFATKA